MGRKGVIRSSLISFWAVDIMTISNGEKSGFVLEKTFGGNKLQPIADGEFYVC